MASVWGHLSVVADVVSSFGPGGQSKTCAGVMRGPERGSSYWVLSSMSPVATCASANSTVAYQTHPQAPEKKKHHLANKRKRNVEQCDSHFGAHLKGDVANIRRGLGVVNGLCTGLDIRIDAVEVRGRESVEVVQPVHRNSVLWR